MADLNWISAGHAIADVGTLESGKETAAAKFERQHMDSSTSAA